MAFLTESEVRERAGRVTQALRKSAGRVLYEATAAADETFDVFLSHSTAEPEEILLGVKKMPEDLDLKVYVDKYSDPQLSPNFVRPQTAEILRARMRKSSTLLYVYSQHSKKSRWMPWELGFFDGLKGSVGIIPVTQAQEETFRGEEYLNLYPHVDVATAENSTERQLWINKSLNVYAPLAGWVTGSAKFQKHN